MQDDHISLFTIIFRCDLERCNNEMHVEALKITNEVQIDAKVGVPNYPEKK